VMRDEQLRNNWDIRNRPALERQTAHFDVVEEVRGLEKSGLQELGPAMRGRHPAPYTVNVRHVIDPSEANSWLPYHNLWIEEGVYFSARFAEEG